MRSWSVSALLSAGLLAGCAEVGEPRDAAYFLDRLHHLDELPQLESSRSELAAHWDPAGGNDLDGRIYPWVDGHRNVLLSVDGPGCIHRISTGDIAAVADTRIEIILDHSELLAMTVAELFDPESGPFAGGLVHSGPYPEVHYPTLRMPIPFAEHAQVRLVSPEQAWGVFWQIGYSRYDPELPVETLSLPLDPRTRAALDAAGDAWLDAVAGSRRPLAPDVALRERVEPGGVLRWDTQGCGVIERIALSIDPEQAGAEQAWRALRLRASWDGAATPAIELPLAEFIGAGDYVGDPDASFDGLIMGASATGKAYLRLPMPFRADATIELRNDGLDSIELELELWVRRCASLPVDFGYLHAAVETGPAATADSPRSGPGQIPVHRVLEREGRGKVVGALLRVDWDYPSLWWGEGDWQIWTDQDFDEWPPRYHGTGTEEFFDAGWTRFDRKALAGAIKQRPGLVTVYGFMLNDAFNYERQLRMQVETVGLLLGDLVVQNEHPTWSSTVYWYDEAP